MLNTLPITDAQRKMVVYWLPPTASGLVAGLAFITLGTTPLIRALALAATIVVMALALRRFGGLLSFAAGLALAFSPAFWSQTGGGQPIMLTLILVIILIAGITAAIFIGFGKRTGMGLIAGLVIFAVLFWELVGTSRSLRLTTFLNVSLIYLLMDALFTANPRPDEPAPQALKPRHTWGLLIILALGVLNDPLLILNAPAVILALLLTRTRLPRWYWGIAAVIIFIGLYGIATQYLSSTWWLYPAATAEAADIRVPFMMVDGWREGTRWLELLRLVIGQFTLIGILLGVVGISRLARWYPPLGVVLTVAYASYTVFGLIYFGKDNAVLLLPLFMIQVVWMTYAAHAFGQWLQKSVQPQPRLVQWAAPMIFTLLPLIMLLRLAGVL
jgi:hypothetical protein